MRTMHTGRLLTGSVGLIAAAGLLIPAAAAAGAPATNAVGCQHDRRAVVSSAGQTLRQRSSYQPCLSDTGLPTGESTIAVDTQGVLYRSVTQSPTGIAISTDGGASWQRRNLPAANRSIATSYLDSRTGRYFYTALGAGPVFFTDNQGRSWQTGTVHSPILFDWPKLFTGRPVHLRAKGYPSNIYYCNWTTLGGFGGAVPCFKSTDGGRNFWPTGSAPIATANECANPKDDGLPAQGEGVVDPRSGTIDIPVMNCGQLWLMTSSDEGATWTRHDVRGARTIRTSTASKAQFTSRAYWKQLLSGTFNLAGPEGSALVQSQALAIDHTGRLYIVWIDERDFQPYFATSKDGGTTWSSAVRADAPGVVQATEPAITVTAGGKVGISYYGTIDPAKYTWTGFLTVTTDPTAAHPVLQSAAVTGNKAPLMSSPCCWAQGLQEYTSVKFGPDGSLWGAFERYASGGIPVGMIGRLRPT